MKKSLKSFSFSSLFAGSCVAVLFACVTGCTIKTEDGNGGDTPNGGTGWRGAGYTYTPSNLSIDAVDLSNLGDCVIERSWELGSNQDSFPCIGTGNAVFTTSTESDGTKVGIYVARSFRIEQNAVVTVRGTQPVALVALDKIEVFGKIEAGGLADTATGGGWTQTVASSKGMGPGGGGAGSENVAGAGGSFCGTGGKGAVDSKGGVLATGGATYGSPSLIPLLGGSSGGKAWAAAGSGGGAVQLVAANSVVVAAGAYINAGGGGSWFGDSDPGEHASGGGSGGAILIEAANVTIAGILAANGGGGGGDNGSQVYDSGDDAKAESTPTKGGVNPEHTKGHGGSGGAATQINGGDGNAETDPEKGTAAAGGGGGAGRIRINTTGGSASITGTVSPALSTSCATQGTLAP